MKSSLLLKCLLTSMVFIGSAASCNTLEWRDGLKKVGDGKLSWFGFTIYQATLYASEGRFHAEQDHALEISYQKAFTREALARFSVEEIERIKGPMENRALVLNKLASVLCDVTSGESISSRHYPGWGATFHCSDKSKRQLLDPELAQSFFSIWLHPDTRRPELRRQLLGMNE